MTDHSFNLVDQPWIVARMADGSSHEISLIEVFRNGKEFVSLGGELATQVFAIHGLLNAILRRALDGPKDTEDWLEWWDDPEGVVDAVVDYLSEFRDRFDLRSPSVPFYQVADLRTQKGERAGLEIMIGDVPNGEPFFTTRRGAGNARISWAEAARWLLHAQAFDPNGIRSGAVDDPRAKGGKVYPQSPGWAALIGGLVLEGENLWQTLMLNLVPEGVGGLDFDPGQDLPPWERPQLTQTVEDRDPQNPGPYGPVDLETWQARRIRLFGDDDGVTGVLIAHGDKVQPQNMSKVEPRTAWRYSDPQTKKAKATTYMPAEHDPDRSLWRGIEALLPNAARRDERVKKKDVLRFRAPALSSWAGDIGRLRGQQVLLRGFARFHAIGVKLGGQQATIADVIDDSLDVPAALLDPSPELDEVRRQVVRAATLTDDLARRFGWFASDLARAAGSRDPDAVIAGARGRLYYRIGEEFHLWLAHVSPATIDTALVNWSATLWQVSEELKEEILRSQGSAVFIGRVIDGRVLDAGSAESRFNRGRRELGITRDGNAEREGKVAVHG